MGSPKKGQLRQFMTPMYDATDFASVESAITESDFNSGAVVKFFGVDNDGSAAFTSGTVSKTARLVKSGVFQITLKGTENNYDDMMVRINKTGCAEQIITWENLEFDNSDLMSRISDVASDLKSFMTGTAGGNPTVSDIASAVRALIVSDLSDILSAAVQGNSRALVNQSRISDIQSFLSDFQSDLISHIDTTGVHINDSDMSDLRSAITATELDASDLSDIASAVRIIMSSDLSDIISAVAVANSRILLNQSRISDTYSMVVANSGILSDILSAVSDLQSDFQSRVPKRVATDSQLSDVQSDLKSFMTGTAGGNPTVSDIASAVRALLISDLSDIHSAATAGASRALINQSRISDVQSFLSDFQSDLISHIDTTGVQLNASVMSDIRSAVAAVTVNLTASDISDIASAVAAAVTTITASDISDIASAVKVALASDMSDILSAAQQTNSRALVNQSRVSDIQSFLSDFQSDLISHLDTTGVQLNASTLSDLRSAIAATELDASDLSDIASAVRTVLVSELSDILSAAQQINSRVALHTSTLSDLYSALSDMQSDFQSRVPKRVATDSQLSALASDIQSTVTAEAFDASDVSDVVSAMRGWVPTEPATEPVLGSGTFQDWQGWWAALSVNKITQTGTKRSLRNTADNATISSNVVSDDGTTFIDGAAS